MTPLADHFFSLLPGDPLNHRPSVYFFFTSLIGFMLSPDSVEKKRREGRTARRTLPLLSPGGVPPEGDEPTGRKEVTALSSTAPKPRLKSSVDDSVP